MFNTTIIIPTKNRLKMLQRAVESISKQSVLPSEIIIIDDFSDIKIEKKFFNNLKNINVLIINNEKSYGGAYSRNIGINKARSKYITFLDDDDAFAENYLEEIANKINILSLNLENIAVYSSKKFVLSSSLNHVFKENISKYIVEKENLLSNNSVGTTSCVTINKQSLMNIKSFDEELPAFQDYDCWLRLSFRDVKFYPVPNAFVYYTINVNSSQISGNFNNHIKAREIILSKFKNNISTKEYIKLKIAVSFFTAKSIHRKNYLLSLKYSLPIVFKKLKSIILIIPYKILNKFGVYTS